MAGVFDGLVALLDQFALWFVFAIVILAVYATFRSMLIGGTTAPLFALGVLLMLLGIWLIFAGDTLIGVGLILGAILLLLLDSWHEKRVVRRGYAAMKG